MAYATGSAELAITVRGSSRRIKIMRFRPANIRLINRRLQLPRLLLVLSSKNHKNNDDQTHELRRLTGSLHIRPMHVSRPNAARNTLAIQRSSKSPGCRGDSGSSLCSQLLIKSLFFFRAGHVMVGPGSPLIGNDTSMSLRLFERGFHRFC